jgi:integrase
MKTLSTVAQVQGAKAPGLYPISNATGLLLQVNEAGNQSWVFRYRMGGTRRLMGLGSITKVSLGDARKAATAAASLRDQGADPIAARRKAKQDKAAALRPKPSRTFQALADEYITIKEKEWKRPDAGKLWRRPFEIWGVYKSLGDIDVANIELADIERALEKAWTAVPETARRMRWRIAEILNRASALGLRDRHAPNPASQAIFKHSKLQGKRPPIKHFPAATLEEAPSLFCRISDANGSVYHAHQFMILTTTRPSEALRAAWSEIDMEKRLWTIPSQRTKTGKEHVVPLTSAAMAVLTAMAAVRMNDYVFPGQRPNAPLSYDHFAKSLHKIDIKHVVPHSWRSVFRDWAGDVADIPRDLAETQLAHSLGATEAAYRRLTAIEKRRAVLERYAAWLTGDAGNNVIRFPGTEAAA